MQRKVIAYNEKLTYFVEYLPNARSEYVKSKPIDTLADAKIVAKIYQTHNLIPKSRIRIVKQTERTTVYEKELKV